MLKHKIVTSAIIVFNTMVIVGLVTGVAFASSNYNTSHLHDTVSIITSIKEIL